MPLESRVINAFYDLLDVIDCEYTKVAQNMIVKKWREVFKTLSIQGSEWMNKENRVVNRIELKPVTKVWVKFLKSRLMPTTHTTTTSLITGICEASRVKFKASDKRIKNKGAVTTKIVKTIFVESTTAVTPGHPTVTKAEWASGIKQMLQELNDRLMHMSKNKKKKIRGFGHT